MINEIVNLSEKLAAKKKKDPELAERMEVAAQGQSPRFLLISSIRRSSQDLQLLDMHIGDAFHATRVPSMALLKHELSPVLFGGPASYNHGFAEKRGVVLTFDLEESPEIIRDSIENLSVHPELDDLPIIVLKIDYDRGEARLAPHSKGRDYEAENWLLSRIRMPERLDEDTLVLICSDSRVHPPETPDGLPMAIQTLGGFVPRFSGREDETAQLNEFFQDWLNTADSPRILIIGHGAFKTSGPPCGAGKASLQPSEIRSKILRDVIQQLNSEASKVEDAPPKTVEERVVSLSSVIQENLESYPAIRNYLERTNAKLIDTLFMNTVTNILCPSAE
jgi:carbonic anhydrase